MRFFRDRLLTHSQIRIGKNKKPIVITKFRTLARDAHKDFDNRLKNSDLTLFRRNISESNGLGKILRRTKLDELPQVISLLKGEINLVGIRPLVRQVYSKLPIDIKKIYAATGPGLLGLDYALPKKQRTEENLCKLYKQFYSEWKKSKNKAYTKYALRILKNGFLLGW